MNILGTGSGTVWLASWGVEIPDWLDTPGEDWTDIGLISEDGFHTIETPVWHGRRHWNSLTTNWQLPAGYDDSVTFTPLEYTEFVNVVEHGGGVWTTNGTIRRFDPPDRTVPVFWSLICDGFDGTRTVRTVLERVLVVSPVDRTFNGDDITRTEITLALCSVANTAPWWQYDDGEN